jgi:hypothetical protein
MLAAVALCERVSEGTRVRRRKSGGHRATARFRFRRVPVLPKVVVNAWRITLGRSRSMSGSPPSGSWRSKAADTWVRLARSIAVISPFSAAPGSSSNWRICWITVLHDEHRSLVDRPGGVDFRPGGPSYFHTIFLSGGNFAGSKLTGEENIAVGQHTAIAQFPLQPIRVGPNYLSLLDDIQSPCSEVLQLPRNTERDAARDPCPVTASNCAGARDSCGVAAAGVV